MKPDEIRPDELVPVYTVTTPWDAEIARIALNSEGIACMVENENQAGFALLPIMEIRIFTRAEDFDRARKILLQEERPGGKFSGRPHATNHRGDENSSEKPSDAPPPDNPKHNARG